MWSFTSGNPWIVYPAFAVGVVFGYTATALLLLTVAAMLFRRRRRSLMAGVSTLSWVLIVTGAIVGLFYLSELVISIWGANAFERQTFLAARLGLGSGWYSAFYYAVTLLGPFVPQFFWFRKVRTTAWLSFIVCLAINFCMCFERLVIWITANANAEFLPSSWK